MKLGKDLREFIELLNSRRVDYIIVGGHAVAYHGHPRFTGDIDFLVRPSSENAERLMDAVREFGFSDLHLSQHDFTKPNTVVQLGYPPNRVDLLTSISGVEFEEAWSTKVGADLDGLPIYFIGWEALLKNKRASGRDRDLADAAKLLAVKAKKR